VLETTDTEFRLRTGPVVVALAGGDLTVSRPEAGTALRVRPGGPALDALAPAAVQSVRADGAAVRVDSDLGWATATLTVTAPEAAPGTVAYRLDLDVDATRPFEGGPELLAPGDCTDYLAGRPGTDPAGGTGDCNQFQFLGLEALDATCLYAPDFTALGGYFEATGTSMHDTVADPPNAFGFAAPGGDVDGTVPVAAATLVFEAGVPAPDATVEYCGRFVDGLAAARESMETPDPERVDWPAIAKRAAADTAHPANRHEYGGVWHPGGVELVTLLSLVNPFRRYAERFGGADAAAIADTAEAAIEAYHDPDFETAAGSTGVVANTPAPADLSLVDAWYFLWPIVQTAEYARETGSERATDIVLDAADAAIDAGRAVDYVFPMWLNVRDLQAVTPAETDWQGHQYDCTGAYVYLMLQFFDLSGERRYLREAERAADRLLSMGFEYPYEFTTAALGPVALAWLADETGTERYREGVAVPLAGVLQHAYHFEPDAGEFAGRRVSGLHAAMPVDDYQGNYYANALEEDATAEYLFRFLRRAFDDLDAPTRRLLGDLLAAKGTALADALPESHPPERVETGVSPQSGRRVNPEWTLPLEPFGALGPAYDRLGEVGQTLYGAGAYATMATLQYHPLWDGATLYTESPSVVEADGEHAVSVRPLADGAVGAALLGDPVDVMDVAVRDADGTDLPVAHDPETGYEFDLEGGERHVVSREVPHRNIVADALDAPDAVAPGEKFAVSVTVRNTGEHSGRYTVRVSVGDEELTQRVDLGAGETAAATVHTSREDSGEYGVRAVRQRRRVRVE
jgi:hypothetical protein